MKPVETLLLSRSEVTELLTIEESIASVENAFKLFATGKAQAPGILGIHSDGGGFHIKAGILNLGRNYFVAKTNANFPGNAQKNGLPSIQGIVSVCDAENGMLLALLDSIEITIIRTGAATAVAAKYLSGANAKTVTICGCGNQGKISLRALTKVRSIKKCFAFDIDEQRCGEFASELSPELNIYIEPVSDLKKAVQQSDIVVTCTPSKKPFLFKNYISPGAFIAAVGSDSEDKQELESSLVAAGKLVTDITSQCAAIGELHHTIEAGLMRLPDVYAELGEVISGSKAGRTSVEEIIIFDSTGTALQDIASAAIVYEKAIARSRGTKFRFAE